MPNASLTSIRPHPRLLVIQNGARHNYAIPAALERAGALAGVYTDVVATQGVGALLAKIVPPASRLGGALKRRVPPPELNDWVCDFGGSFLAAQAASAIAGTTAGYRIFNQLSQHRMTSRGTQGATHIYTMFGEGGGFLRRARDEGLGIVGDVYIALSADQIVSEEAACFPDWADGIPVPTTRSQRVALNENLLTLSDVLVCPSDFVRDDLLRHGIDEDRTVVIPYGVNSRWLSLEHDPEQGRILFAGTATIRKGIHYLAAAASLLKGRCRFRVAGAVSEKVRLHPLARDLEFLGHLDPVRMAEEFYRADVFAFPSLVEGAAGVTNEALGAGIPVVTTEPAGSVVQNGVEGSIVPVRDSYRLAESILAIVEDREKRLIMSSAARARAQVFTWDHFARNVLKVLDTPTALASQLTTGQYGRSA